MKFLRVLFGLLLLMTALLSNENLNKKQLAYIVSDMSIPFWQIMSSGVKSSAESLGYEVAIYSSNNDSKTEIENTVKALKNKVDGIIVSPTNSLACVTILRLAKNASIPVVISDIGTDGGEYVSYISSNNLEGAYDIGKVLTKAMINKNLQDGKVGIIAIPQQRANGKARTAGFMKALDEAGIKSADIKQQVTFSYEETYEYSKELINNYPDLKAIWLQGSDKYKGALDAIKDSGKKNEILLITFDAELEFLDLIPKGILVGSAMQQPYLMGQESVKVMDLHLNGKEVQKNIQLPILAVSSENIEEMLPIIRKNVLGIEK
ncbi:substrate-binding domain-containing protein [Arcobacter sp. FWKO B]|uniref:substrate-binding domain-containing protein n=1 Tax=Arcobacter sp. FWKO B TaxID=2593672 RepID=UPI0018A4A68C|nr:substrate-binding domain-containing protein [Arcobacter sp. FWKO B]QOG11905.1 substrate-binding domain-containing protein [Arcobacter sp. FWKO B]